MGTPLQRGAPPPAGRPGAGGAFAAALPGALVPELLWAHYMPALSVDCEQNKGPAFRARGTRRSHGAAASLSRRAALGGEVA